MKHTLEEINEHVRFLEEQSRRYKSIASISGKSLIDCDTYLLGYRYDKIKACLIDLFIDSMKADDGQMEPEPEPAEH